MAMQDFGSEGAFILGGSGGIGRAICQAFARHGTPVALSYRQNEAAARETADAVIAAGARAEVYQLDGADRSGVARVLEEAAEQMGGLHSVVYAGGPTFDPCFFGRIEESAWEQWLRDDMMSAINLAQAAIPHLRRSGGAFTAISTYQGNMIEVRGGISAISKAAIDRMIAVMAKEEGRFGVRANSVRCGWIGTETVDRLFEAMPHLREDKQRTVPLGRVGRPEEIGETVVFLSSRRAGFITGANLIADGGESL